MGKMSIASAHMPRRSPHTALGLRRGLEREPRAQTPTIKKKSMYKKYMYILRINVYLFKRNVKTYFTIKRNYVKTQPIFNR